MPQIETIHQADLRFRFSSPSDLTPVEIRKRLMTELNALDDDQLMERVAQRETQYVHLIREMHDPRKLYAYSADGNRKVTHDELRGMSDEDRQPFLLPRSAAGGDTRGSQPYLNLWVHEDLVDGAPVLLFVNTRDSSFYGDFDARAFLDNAEDADLEDILEAARDGQPAELDGELLDFMNSDEPEFSRFSQFLSRTDLGLNDIRVTFEASALESWIETNRPDVLDALEMRAAPRF